jgi:hypothetical protein
MCWTYSAGITTPKQDGVNGCVGAYLTYIDTAGREQQVGLGMLSFMFATAVLLLAGRLCLDVRVGVAKSAGCCTRRASKVPQRRFTPLRAR